MIQISAKETAARLLACESAEILIHRSPDGDCIGSGYALMYALRLLGKKARVLCSDEIPARYHFMLPECDTLEYVAPDLIVAIDVADAKLLGENLADYRERVDLCIDHHISNTGYARELCLDGNAAAACQVLYAVLRELPLSITDEIAMCLYTGLATDTGCFLYDNVSPQTLRMAADLMEQHPQVPYARINRNMFVVKSRNRMHLDGVLADLLETYFDGACALVCITREVIAQRQIDEAELEGVADFPLRLEGVQVSLVIKEKEPGIFRVSMRSADYVNVSAICAQFGGGGHVKAAGCTICGTADTVKEALLAAVAKGLAAQ